MKKIIFISVSLFALLVLGCTEDPITKPEQNLPEIEQVFAPAIAYISDTTLVQAVIRDPQGVANIAGVSLVLNNPVGLTHELAMRDDGVDGDSGHGPRDQPGALRVRRGRVVCLGDGGIAGVR